jgi:predicted small integral membrane protein
MLLIRLAKIVMVAALAAFAFLVTYDNIVDYNSNYEFARHVLSKTYTPSREVPDAARNCPCRYRKH